MENPTMFLLFSSSLFSILVLSVAVDNINATGILKDGEVLVSSGGNFKLGFFTPAGGSNYRYVGIWYNKISVPTVVWVANRRDPLIDTSGQLRLVEPGILALFNNASITLWSTNTSRSSRNPVAQLLDTGNLVVKDAGDSSDPENFLWQSFDYPGDTLLAGMKHGVDLVTGLDRSLRSWKSEDDPSIGYFTYGYEPQGYPQLILRNNSVVQFRSGPWNGAGFSGMPNLKKNTIYKFEFVFNDKEAYFIYELENSSIISRFVLNPEGAPRRFIWVERTQTWAPYLISAQRDTCDTYKLCGPHGTCNVEISPPCQCLDKFVQKYPNQWVNADWSNGCIRRTPLNCSTDGFLKYSAVKLPDTRTSWFNRTMRFQECEAMCLKNCLCMAYTSLDIRNGGSGCLFWSGDLLDIRQIPQNGQDIYIRMAASELGQSGSHKKKSDLAIILPVVLGIVVLLMFSIFACARKRKSLKNEKANGQLENMVQQDCINRTQKEDLDLPLFNLATISEATNNFSLGNKIGEGGFGPVYKGVLDKGQEIAVKRLSMTSKQGLDEFKNEVICIAKLQHRNLVRLLGCCIEGEESMLIYEYMPNKSLDFFIFDENRRVLLDWPKRFHIINGVARGLLYLHQDSRLRIIHRDLKAGNILLDSKMNPKISDFGLARLFGENETRAKTKRVVGTYGYMSPEYVVDGLFSIKSDVFSFGVLVLEIVSGKRNKGFFHKDHQHNLLGHAWGLYNEGKFMELADESLDDSCHQNEVLRSIHVGLLCVQQRLEDRPNMSSVVLMLSGEGTMSSPKLPGFFTERSVIDSENSSSTNPTGSINEVTVTTMDGR